MAEPEFDNAQAHAEGWGIFDCDGSANGPYQIQRIDSPDEWNDSDPIRLHYHEAVFAGDDEAWAHVVGKALDGSVYHLSALLFVATHNRREFVAILKAHPELGSIKP